MFVKPKEGYSIRDPYKKDLIPAEGREVPDADFYWVRLLKDGDVVRATPPMPPASSKRTPQPSRDTASDSED